MPPQGAPQVMEHTWGEDKWPKASQPLVLPGDRVLPQRGLRHGLRDACESNLRRTGASSHAELLEKQQDEDAVPNSDDADGRCHPPTGSTNGKLAAMDIATG